MERGWCAWDIEFGSGVRGGERRRGGSEHSG